MPDCPPTTDAAIYVGVDQEYKVDGGIMPLVAFVGVTENCTPLQVTLVIADTSGIGFSVTINVNHDPVQFPETGTTR
jgi:hypothetical protein